MTADHFPAAVWSDRLGDWTVEYFHPETTVDEGSFILNGDTRHGPDDITLPVAVYRPGRDGTHTPLGPRLLEIVGLRERPAGTEPPP